MGVSSSTQIVHNLQQENQLLKTHVHKLQKTADELSEAVSSIQTELKHWRQRQRPHTVEHSLARPRDNATGSSQWDKVCRVEQARGIAYLSGRPRSRFLDSLLPLAGVDRGSTQSTIRELRSILQARGTICSEDVPCLVKSDEHGGPASKKFKVCIGRLGEDADDPMLCEPVQSTRSKSSFFLKKGCRRGLAARCFKFDLELIDGWLRRLKAFAAAHHEASHLTADVRPVNRCAVVLSGHTLRCGVQPWAPLFDGTYYDKVLRANWMSLPASYDARSHVGGTHAGSRVDWTIEVGGARGARCRQLQGGKCISDEVRRGLANLTRATPGQKEFADANFHGLGFGRSGGSLLEVALAFCNTTDVYGSGMYSEGPGSDVLYQHWSDPVFATGCRAHKCVPVRVGTTVDKKSARNIDPGMRQKAMGVDISHVCSPNERCKNFLSKHAQKAGVSPSDEAHDFFFLSEIRLYVLHAIGAINFVWY